MEIIKSIEQRLQSLSDSELVEECMSLWYGHNIPYTGNSRINDELRDRIKRDVENKICSLSESGNAYAAYYRGRILEESGNKCEDKEISNNYYQRAAYWYKLSADAGNYGSAARLAEYYLYGWSIPKDEYLSFQYAKLAATDNNPKGLLLVGNFFYDGVIQEYEWHKDSTCYYCVRKKECLTHMHKVNRVILSNNIDSARFYWEKTIENSPKGPVPGGHPRIEAKQRLERIYNR